MGDGQQRSGQQGNEILRQVDQGDVARVKRAQRHGCRIARNQPELKNTTLRRSARSAHHFHSPACCIDSGADHQPFAIRRRGEFCHQIGLQAGVIRNEDACADRQPKHQRSGHPAQPVWPNLLPERLLFRLEEDRLQTLGHLRGRVDRVDLVQNDAGKMFVPSDDFCPQIGICVEPGLELGTFLGTQKTQRVFGSQNAVILVFGAFGRANCICPTTCSSAFP